MDLKSIDTELKRHDQSAARERKRILEEMQEDAAEIVKRAGRLVPPDPDPERAKEPEGSGFERFRKHVKRYGIDAMTTRRPDWEDQS